MNLAIERRDRFAIVTVSAEKLDGIISPELKAELVKLNGEGYKSMVLDLSNARYCDSSGLSAILVGNRLCKNAGGSFVLCNLQDAVKKLVSISQLDTILNITPTLDEALDFLMMEEVERDLDPGTEEP